MRLLRKGATLVVISREAAVSASTAWSYASSALCFVSTRTSLKYTRQLLLDPSAEVPFRRMMREKPHLFHAPLTTLVNEFTKTWMAGDPLWRTNCHRYAEVRSLRSQLRREV
jgi:hypothetical protein